MYKCNCCLIVWFEVTMCFKVWRQIKLLSLARLHALGFELYIVECKVFLGKNICGLITIDPSSETFSQTLSKFSIEQKINDRVYS